MFCRCRASGPAPPRVIRYDHYAERVDGGDGAAADDAALAQPGLIPRDPARGDRLETIAYFGSDQYEPQFVKTDAFQDALRQRGSASSAVSKGNGTITSMWMPYWQSVIALLLCWQPNRHPADQRMESGSTRLLGPEPAYRELRTSPLDFLEAASAEAVLDSIDRLQQESGLYRRMTEHGAKRRKPLM